MCSYVLTIYCELPNLDHVLYMWHKMANNKLPVYGIMGNIWPRVGGHYGCHTLSALWTITWYIVWTATQFDLCGGRTCYLKHMMAMDGFLYHTTNCYFSKATGMALVMFYTMQIYYLIYQHIVIFPLFLSQLFLRNVRYPRFKMLCVKYIHQ